MLMQSRGRRRREHSSAMDGAMTNGVTSCAPFPLLQGSMGNAMGVISGSGGELIILF